MVRTVLHVVVSPREVALAETVVADAEIEVRKVVLSVVLLTQRVEVQLALVLVQTIVQIVVLRLEEHPLTVVGLVVGQRLLLWRAEQLLDASIRVDRRLALLSSCSKIKVFKL